MLGVIAEFLGHLDETEELAEEKSENEAFSEGELSPAAEVGSSAPLPDGDEALVQGTGDTPRENPGDPAPEETEAEVQEDEALNEAEGTDGAAPPVEADSESVPKSS